MSDAAFTIKPEARKAAWRTSRLLLWSLVVTLVVLGIFRIVDPFAFWKDNLQLFFTLGGWIISYHVIEAVRKR